ncbi:MAG: 4-hydroxythreonine-4-phosphate dehydrogenase PdxA [Oceanospirillaceae bacterium]|nr:4-hydroxythreonine-4-phosphate dehydrogenase PdxA [Oceanospirillaceae bacterium]
MIKRIAITSGEPAGIGPELLVKISQQDYTDQLVAIGDPELFAATAKALGLTLEVLIFDPSVQQASRSGQLFVSPIKLNAAALPGHLDIANSSYVIATLEQACQGCLQGQYDAMVTPPVHKGVINEAGIKFSGHTEYLQQQTGVSEVVMMLATAKLRVALVTTHLPLKDISNAITKHKLRQILDILIDDLHTKFAIDKPRILICGLNPHAGEDGHMGTEEIDIISPVLKEYTAQGIDLVGPLPADSLFTKKYLKDCDAVLAMYHDQGLPVLKYSGFGEAVNITLGLPIIRTSVDHGTALNIAGLGVADTGSLKIAINYASQLAHQSSSQTKGQFLS